MHLLHLVELNLIIGEMEGGTELTGGSAGTEALLVASGVYVNSI